MPIFLDRVSFREIEPVNIQIQEIPFGKHFLVVEADPFLPVSFFFRRQIDVFEFGAIIWPSKFGSQHAARAQRGSEISPNVLFLIGEYIVEAGQFHMIAVNRGLGAQAALCTF